MKVEAVFLMQYQPKFYPGRTIIRSLYQTRITKLFFLKNNMKITIEDIKATDNSIPIKSEGLQKTYLDLASGKRKPSHKPRNLKAGVLLFIKYENIVKSRPFEKSQQFFNEQKRFFFPIEHSNFILYLFILTQRPLQV